MSRIQLLNAPLKYTFDLQSTQELRAKKRSTLSYCSGY